MTFSILSVLHHSNLPTPLDRYVSLLVLEHVPNADTYLMGTMVLLTALVFIQLKAFSRPKPVPMKQLPRRPVLQILFKPDDYDSTATAQQPSATNTTEQSTTTESHQHQKPRKRRLPSDVMRSVTESIFRTANNNDTKKRNSTGEGGWTPPSAYDFGTDTFQSGGGDGGSNYSYNRADSDTDEDYLHEPSSPKTPPTVHFSNLQDLPDSFAPLLSSSHVELIWNQLTTDLIHAIQVKASVRIRPGRHEIPLDKDNARPQFTIQPMEQACRITAVATVGSDGLSNEQDLDPSLLGKRSQSMVKQASLVLDPPLPLHNVAPTLIHFPTLFEDNYVPTLRQIQLVRIAIDFISSISSFLEKILWIIESKCQIHLSKVQMTPLYKGTTKKKTDNDNNNKDADEEPEWRLSLSFSGHVLLFGVLPIPFISVTLPTFIIPQPHAMLEYLATPQPLASAKLKREKFNEKRIALAAIHAIEGWNVDLKTVVTPPALGVDITLPGGVALAIELVPAKDFGCKSGKQQHQQDGIGNVKSPNGGEPSHHSSGDDQHSVSNNSMSSWTTRPESLSFRRSKKTSMAPSTPSNANHQQHQQVPAFDANKLVPWSFEFSAKGSISKDRMSVHIIKCRAAQEDYGNTTAGGMSSPSYFSTAGSFGVWKADLATTLMAGRTNKSSLGHMAALSSSVDEESPSLAAMLLYPEETTNTRRLMTRLLGYDYAFDVFDTQIHAMTCSVGASHPMLKGGTMISMILESIYMGGSATARDGAIMNPGEWMHKRNILRHLPAVDFTFGIQNAYIPTESMSYSDTGQNRCTPEMEGGRVMVRFLGGIAKQQDDATEEAAGTPPPVSDGIKVIADIGADSLSLSSDAFVKEFPELDIFEGVQLKTLLAGALSCQISSHLRPQNMSKVLSTTGPNTKNPLEAYEIDFGDSSLSFRIKESMSTLGHRRVIIPTETTLSVKIVESVVDMSLEGKTQCELSWDFQGLSPILQVTDPGESPADAMHENRRQVSLLIAPLRQGRLNFHVSPVGGVVITKAETSREDRKGLYDWKFFNAIVSPDDESAERLLNVVHDKRTMEKLLQVVELINTDMHKIMRYILKQVWRAKEIFDQEGVSDPGHAIPGTKMARLVSLFLCGDVSQADKILPVIHRVTSGEGLDVLKVKELLRQHVEAYDEWAPEIDRAVRWASIMLGPMSCPQTAVEGVVPPLSEVPRHVSGLRNIPSAKTLYAKIHDKPQLPLEASFSNLVSFLSPYLSFSQVEYFLQVRKSSDWQASDLRRLRYVYAVKKKVQEISESYGGLSFLPQSFLVSVFLGEATRAGLRAARLQHPKRRRIRRNWSSSNSTSGKKVSTLSTLRRRRIQAPPTSTPLGDILEQKEEDYVATPAGRVASQANFVEDKANKVDIPDDLFIELGDNSMQNEEDEVGEYELGDSLLGPVDVAILLQAGLTSAMKSSTVVQLNQRMLLDLITSQPRSFAIAVLAEIGNGGGQGSPRGLTSALMALLELDQNSFTPVNRLDMHALLESWLPGFKVPRRDDYMAGGRWARQSYYEALFSVSKGILEDAEHYMALKLHVQKDRKHTEEDPLPQPREYRTDSMADLGMDISEADDRPTNKLTKLTDLAKEKILKADRLGNDLMDWLIRDERGCKKSSEYKAAVDAYQDAFQACKDVLEVDSISFHASWFSDFYRRNYDALMLFSMHSNVMEDVDTVRHWFSALRKGSTAKTTSQTGHPQLQRERSVPDETLDASIEMSPNKEHKNIIDEIGGFIGGIGRQSAEDRQAELARVDIFSNPGQYGEQAVLDAIVDAIIYREKDRHMLRKDPLVRLLIPNQTGHYNFAIVTAMGVITEGQRGKELEDAFRRLEEQRGVKVYRSDTGTARSFEFNAAKIIEAIETVSKDKIPYGLLGYSQGCANALTAESLLLSGSPKQQALLIPPPDHGGGGGLVCRQMLFSAANGSTHGPAADTKVQRLIVLCEEFFKYQQGYFSRAFASGVLEVLSNLMDSAPFQKFVGGAQSFLPDGCRVFWREAQHLPHIPTCTMRGVLESHTLPESLEMISHLLSKQSGSALHDSQVHVYDAVPYPVYCTNRNGRLLKHCAVGDGAIQRTHHWSPLSDEVEFMQTQRDVVQGSFECAKDRHVFPWVDVNVRFGFIKYESERKAKQRDDEAKVKRTASPSEMGGERPESWIDL